MYYLTSVEEEVFLENGLIKVIREIVSSCQSQKRGLFVVSSLGYYKQRIKYFLL